MIYTKPPGIAPGGQLVEKVHFYKNGANSLSLTPNPFPWEGAILLGLPPLVPVGGFAPATPIFNN